MGSFILSIMIATILAPLLSVGHVQANLEATCPGIPDSAQCLSGRFRAFWEQNGGLPVFGFPISPAQDESDRTSDRTLQTQWFERARFELHTENAAPYDVLLGRLGADRLQQTGRNWQAEPREDGPNAGCLWFQQTGHNVCDQGAAGGFKSYWQTHGVTDRRLGAYERSLVLFGLPLTEPRMETNSSGDAVLTQWFERARFEWHQNKAGGSRVLLGLLGDEVHQRVDVPPVASGITGVILLGPMCPGPEQPNHPCPDQPYKATVVVEEQATGRKVIEFTSGEDGRFSVSLLPNNYRLVPLTPGGNLLPSAPPMNVTVPPDKLVEITIRYDTGIR